MTITEKEYFTIKSIALDLFKDRSFQDKTDFKTEIGWVWIEALYWWLHSQGIKMPIEWKGRHQPSKGRKYHL